MSKLSIFAPQWIDLVFENRNKDYGAYQLRQENPKTLFFSLFMAIAFTLSAYTVFAVVSLFNPEAVITIPTIIDTEVIITDVIFPPKDEPKKAITPPVKKQTSTEPIKKHITNPIIVDQKIATDDLAKNSDVNNTTQAATSSPGLPGGTEIKGTSVPVEPEKPSHGNTTFGMGELDKNPKFPGGIDKFLTYVATNFKADEEIESTIKVTVSFVVEKDGSMSNIAVRNNPGYGMGEEAIRVLKSMKTKWEPGMKDGEKVRAFYNLPITIKL